MTCSGDLHVGRGRRMSVEELRSLPVGGELAEVGYTSPPGLRAAPSSQHAYSAVNENDRMLIENRDDGG